MKLVAALLSFGFLAAAAPASAESMPTAVKSCKQIRADYPGGVAKTKKAKRKIVKKGYKKPIICPRVYKQAVALDRNHNKVVCESR
ncbi:MAG: excalibur calcium-binding domain-containing protein [Candidatus Nanopelagicales bacterium]